MDFKPDEIEKVPKLKSDRIFKSATPKYTVDWYVKWFASIMSLIALSIRGIPELIEYDLTFTLVGVMGWLFVSIQWRDRALILLNGAACLLLIRTIMERSIG